MNSSKSLFNDSLFLILNKANGADRLIIGTADATPKDARFENLKAVGEVIDKVGRSN